MRWAKFNDEVKRMRWGMMFVLAACGRIGFGDVLINDASFGSSKKDSAYSGISFVQIQEQANGKANTVQVGLTVQQGDLLLGTITFDPQTMVAAIDDTAGNAYTLSPASDGIFSDRQYIVY